ncbi:MAG TPA: PIG-L family deacetylase [Gemmatales bacterium]|nr:PIG-L family deacetylase [Gemmatales bacterium]
MCRNITNLRVLLCGTMLFAVVLLVAIKPDDSVANSTDPIPQPATPAIDGKLRIICFGAHPDDCEIKIGGTAAIWAAKGHHVKFVSLTNGDIGHWRMSGPTLAKRRSEEVQRGDKLLGVETVILDIHDGELEPSLANRRTVTELIREWKADMVFSHRPNDYHPDHRYTGVLVQDAAYMVTVPFFCPKTPYLTRNPVFMYYADRFERANPTRADMVVGIDDSLDKKLAALELMESQFLEGGANGNINLIPKDAAERERRQKQVRESFMNRDASTAKRFGDRLAALYGTEQAKKIGHAEAFEICEYGTQPGNDELKRLFPFLP